MMSFLTEILRHKRLEVSSRKSPRRQAHLKRRLVDLDPTRGFAAALRRPAGAALRLIAEIKKASPSKGLIREDFDPVRIAASYASAGAQALSVLTDCEFFQGDLAYLAAVREAVTLPILEKDFVIDEFQIYEARVLGADAVLLIAAALEDRQIEEYLALAAELALSALVEVHDERELERVAERATLIGINNRNLATFTTDLTVTERVLREMPAGRIVVSESGMVCRDDVRRLADTGVDAVLIGETFMRAVVIEDAVRDLMTPEAEPIGSRAGRRGEPGAVAR